jgi:hypothetical protein
MPCGDGTGPWWAQERHWKCVRTFDQGNGFRWKRISTVKPINLTKDQQKSILEEELKDIEGEKQKIEKKLKELSTKD